MSVNCVYLISTSDYSLVAERSYNGYDDEIDSSLFSGLISAMNSFATEMEAGGSTVMEIEEKTVIIQGPEQEEETFEQRVLDKYICALVCDKKVYKKMKKRDRKELKDNAKQVRMTFESYFVQNPQGKDSVQEYVELIKDYMDAFFLPASPVDKFEEAFW